MLSHQVDMMAYDMERAARQRLDARLAGDPERAWLSGKVLAVATPRSGRLSVQRVWGWWRSRRGDQRPASAEQPAALNTPA